MCPLVRKLNSSALAWHRASTHSNGKNLPRSALDELTEQIVATDLRSTGTQEKRQLFRPTSDASSDGQLAHSRRDGQIVLRTIELRPQPVSDCGKAPNISLIDRMIAHPSEA
jgi:hypothetical protein